MLELVRPALCLPPEMDGRGGRRSRGLVLRAPCRLVEQAGGDGYAPERTGKRKSLPSGRAWGRATSQLWEKARHGAADREGQTPRRERKRWID